MSDCLFCKIANKEVPADNIIYEDESALGLLDVNPLAPGQTVVIPRTHAENILELSDDEVNLLFRAVKKVTDLLDKTIKPDGFTIGINHKVGQAIDHLHVLVIPRYNSDGGTSIHGVVNNPPKESLQVIKEKILKAS
ncbi:MAG: HIT family protein [Patescibacteria group bacterium]|nr:HIT family protein [Patescibacteria group bacterium]